MSKECETSTSMTMVNIRTLLASLMAYSGDMADNRRKVEFSGKVKRLEESLKINAPNHQPQ